MRPIEKGDWPVVNGIQVEYTEYGQARPELINRIGDFCSYCENQITNPALEHEQPKAVTPGAALNWYNFLLSCVSCNSRKGHNWLNLNDYYWPDIHNTHLLFDFTALGAVTIKRVLDPSVDVNRAQRTLELTGLHLYGHNTTVEDRRWIKRAEAWGKAEFFLNLYNAVPNPQDLIKGIVHVATSTGFWSVWMKVFDHFPEVQDALIMGYGNTYFNCRINDINRL